MSLLNFLVKMKLDATEVETGVKRVEGLMTGLGSKLAGAFTLAAFGKFAYDAINATSAAADLAEQLGITIEQVQALEDAAGDSGIELNKYADAILKVKKAQAAAMSGDKSASAAFKTLGIDPNQDPFEALKAIAAAANKGPGQYDVATDLLGKGGGKMLSSLTKTGGDFAVDSANAQALDTVADRFGNMLRFFRRVTAQGLGYLSMSVNELGSLNRPKFLRDEALPLPPRKPGSDQSIEDNMAALGLDFKRRKERSKLEESLSDPFNLRFQSSTQNDRAKIGGFFIGADATARMDIQRQQLQKQTVMADRIAKIEEQMRKITEDEG